jgi:hypothetical protein
MRVRTGGRAAIAIEAAIITAVVIVIVIVVLDRCVPRPGARGVAAVGRPRGPASL